MDAKMEAKARRYLCSFRPPNSSLLEFVPSVARARAGTVSRKGPLLEHLPGNWPKATVSLLSYVEDEDNRIIVFSMKKRSDISLELTTTGPRLYTVGGREVDLAEGKQYIVLDREEIESAEFGRILSCAMEEESEFNLFFLIIYQEDGVEHKRCDITKSLSMADEGEGKRLLCILADDKMIFNIEDKIKRGYSLFFS